MVPSARVARPSVMNTFWPPRLYSPLGMPQACMASLMMHTRSDPNMLNTARTTEGFRWMPSQIISMCSAKSLAAPTTPGAR